MLAVAPRPDGSLVVIASDGPRGQAYVLDGTASYTPLGGLFGDPAATRFLFPSLSAVQGHLAVSWNNDYPDDGRRQIFAGRFDPTSQSFAVLGGQPLVRCRRARPTRAPLRRLARWIHVSAYADSWVPLPNVGGTLPAIAIDRRDLPVVSWVASSKIGVARASAP